MVNLILGYCYIPLLQEILFPFVQYLKKVGGVNLLNFCLAVGKKKPNNLSKNKKISTHKRGNIQLCALFIFYQYIYLIVSDCEEKGNVVEPYFFFYLNLLSEIVCEKSKYSAPIFFANYRYSCLMLFLFIFYRYIT